MDQALTKRVHDLVGAHGGARPEASAAAEQLAAKIPLSAFGVLRGGDVVDVRGRAPADGLARAKTYVDKNVMIHEHGAHARHVARVRSDIAQQLSGNLALLERMQAARTIVIDLVPMGKRIPSLGYPKMSRNAAGLFWNQKKQEIARMALRQDCLDDDPVLVCHEVAHAVHYLALSEKERAVIYDLLRPTFGSKAAIDEVFAIYSEREFIDSFGDRELRAPGVYGHARRQWSEDHLFTRFVRKLYFPYKGAAGPGMASSGGGDWMRGLSRR